MGSPPVRLRSCMAGRRCYWGSAWPESPVRSREVQFSWFTSSAEVLNAQIIPLWSGQAATGLASVPGQSHEHGRAGRKRFAAALRDAKQGIRALSPDSVRRGGLHPGLLSFLPSGKKAVASPFRRGMEPSPATEINYAIARAGVQKADGLDCFRAEWSCDWI